MKKTFVLLHIAVLLAGFTGVFGKLISLNEYLLTCYRTLFSFLFLLVIVWIRKPQFSGSWRSIWEMGKAGLLISLHWVFFYASIKYSNVSVGVVCYCLTSFFTAFLAPLINKKPFNVTELLLSTLTLAGIGLIFHFDTSFRTGIILGVISSFLASLYTIFNERLVKKYESIVINMYQMLSGQHCSDCNVAGISLFFSCTSNIAGSYRHYLSAAFGAFLHDGALRAGCRNFEKDLGLYG